MKKEIQEKIEDYIRKYPSVKKWFLKPDGERRYKPTTERANIKCLELWCTLLNKNPDQLVPSNLEEAEVIQRKIVGMLHLKTSLGENGILQHTTKYHSFCRHNGFDFPYGGDKLRNVLRLVKWEFDELKENKTEA